MMKILIKKWIRHGYARVSSTGELSISVPYALRGDQKFIASLQQKGETLLASYQQKIQQSTFHAEGFFIFGEKIEADLLPHFASEKEKTLFLKNTLEEYASPLIESYANKLGFKNIPLQIKKLRSRWGSCSYDNRIMLNLMLVHLPTKLIQYVIIHEACHLREKNHAPAFWKLVEQFCPNYKALRKELKTQVFS